MGHTNSTVVQKDMDLLLLDDSTQENKDKPLTICVSDGDCTLNPDCEEL